MTKGARSELFLSCDLVGSTSYKQATPGWQTAFLAFYRQFPQAVAEACATTEVNLTFDLWKPVGDELIFTVTVASERDVYDAVRVWLAAMADYRDVLAKDTSMSTKGGAFIATFPGPDSESSIPRDPDSESSGEEPVVLNDRALNGQRRHTKYLYDYFGPSIDTGFRVLSRCTPRHFSLSVEVAWALFLAGRDTKDVDIRDVCFLGLHELKGVWQGRDYPLFAIDVLAEDGINEAVSKLTNGDLNTDLAEKVCRECVTSRGWVSGLYLPDAVEPVLRAKPPDSLELARQRAPKLTGAETLLEGDQQTGRQLPKEVPLGGD